MEHKANMEVKVAFAAAIKHAIESMGVDRFKETSFFGSNEKRETEFKEAA